MQLLHPYIHVGYSIFGQIGTAKAHDGAKESAPNPGKVEKTESCLFKANMDFKTLQTFQIRNIQLWPKSSSLKTHNLYCLSFTGLGQKIRNNKWVMRAPFAQEPHRSSQQHTRLRGSVSRWDAKIFRGSPRGRQPRRKHASYPSTCHTPKMSSKTLHPLAKGSTNQPDKTKTKKRKAWLVDSHQAGEEQVQISNSGKWSTLLEHLNLVSETQVSSCLTPKKWGTVKIKFTRTFFPWTDGNPTEMCWTLESSFVMILIILSLPKVGNSELLFPFPLMFAFRNRSISLELISPFHLHSHGRHTPSDHTL